MAESVERLRAELATHGQTCKCPHKMSCENREGWLIREIARHEDPTPNGGGEAWDERVAWLKGLHIVAGGGVRPASLSYVTAGEYRADAERLIDRLRTALAAAEGERDEAIRQLGVALGRLAAAERAGAEKYRHEIIARIGSGDYQWPTHLVALDVTLAAIHAALYPTGGTDG